MKIEKIEILSTSEKYYRPIPIAVGTQERRENIIVRITADNGLAGYGEGSPLIPSYSGETRDQMVDDIVKRIAPDILVREIETVQDVVGLMDLVYRNKYYYMCTLAAVDIALFDLLGKMREKPVFQLVRDHLGLGEMSEIPRLPANFTVSRRATDEDDQIPEMIREAEECVDRGYSVIKVKIGVHRDSDVESIKRLYSHLGKKYRRRIYLFADGNQAYGTVDEALEVVGEIKECIVCLEQPFHRDIPHLSSELNRKLKKMQKAPLLITDEGSASIEEMENCLISDAGGGALLKMVRSGGFSYVLKLARLLRDFPGFKLAPCSMTETGIGTMANLHSALIIYEHCHPLLGFGFDGPMQVVGESYREGNDTIIYERGLITRDTGGTAVYDPGQVVGDGRGLGLKINSRYLEKITIGVTTVTVSGGDVVMDACVNGRRTREIIGSREGLLKHPRY